MNYACPHPYIAEGQGSLLICFNTSLLSPFSSFCHLLLPKGEDESAELGAIWVTVTVLAAHWVVNG